MYAHSKVRILWLMGSFIFLVLMLFTTASFSSGYTSPKEAFISFVQAIQNGDVENSFALDYSEQRKTQGKFKHELSDMKKQYGKYFNENPSICPQRYSSGVPCDGPSQRNLVSDIRLLIPKTSKYEISEIVYTMKMLKSVGRSGQISLGKQYAGKTVMIEQIETGVWLLKIGEFIPVSERWLHDPAVSQDLNEAIAWAEKHPPQDSDMSALESRMKL